MVTMKSKSCKTLVLAVCAASIIIIAGCEGQNLSDVKKARLTMLENSRLQKEIDNQESLCRDEIEKQKDSFDNEIKKQKDLHNNEVKQQKKLCDIELERQRILPQQELETYKKALAECTEGDENLLLKKAKEETQNLSDMVLKVFEEITKLREENEKLKSQLALLEDQLKQLEAEPK